MEKIETDKIIAPCSLTHLFVDSSHPHPYYTNNDIIYKYKMAYQMLQLTILEGAPENLTEIGQRFLELETQFEKLIREIV